MCVFFFVAFVRSVLIVTDCCLTASYITLYGLHYSTAYECVCIEYSIHDGIGYVGHMNNCNNNNSAAAADDDSF